MSIARGSEVKGSLKTGVYLSRRYFADRRNPEASCYPGVILFKEVINEALYYRNCFHMFISISNVYALDIQPGEWKMENKCAPSIQIQKRQYG